MKIIFTKMTHDEKLNAILYKYLHAETLRLSNDPRYSKLTFDFIIKTQISDNELWEKDFLKDRLFEDGYLKENGIGRGEPYFITNSGIKFIQSGGYVKDRERLQLNYQIQKDTLKTNRFSRRHLNIGIFLTIIGIIVTIVLAIFFNY